MLGSTIGLRGLLTARQAMDLLGQNVANFATEGYSRRTLTLRTTETLSVAGVGSFGTGVKLGEVRRVHDALLVGRLRDETSLWLRAQSESGNLRLLEASFDESAGTGLGQAFDDVFSSLSSLVGAPQDAARQSAVVGDLGLLTAGFQRLAGDLDRLGADVVVALQEEVLDTNEALDRVAAVNARILQQAGASPPAALLDDLDRALSDLSQHVDVRVVERDRGAVDVLSGGELLVSGTRAAGVQLQSQAGQLSLQVDGRALQPTGGRLAALYEFSEGFLDDPRARLDEIARDLALAVNRIHTTAVPDGGYSSLIAELRPQARQQGADPSLVPLSQLDLPVEIQSGRLSVNVVDRDDGSLRRTLLEIDPEETTLAEFAAQLDAIDSISARLDADGRLRLNADPGFGFDFSARLDGDPDDAGAFGGSAAQLASSSGPFALGDGQEITIAVDGGVAQTLRFDAADFADFGAATAEELAAVLNAQLSGASAQVVDGRVLLRSDSSGAAGSLLAADGGDGALAELGFGEQLEQGQEIAVRVRLEGKATAGDEGRFELRIVGEGTIGQTEGLIAEVVDADSGRVLSRLDVGAGYTPGEPLEVVPGVHLRLGAGEVSESAGDFFQFELLGDGDETDLLVGLGLGTLLRGQDAASLDVVSRVANDPRLLAADGDSVLALSGLVDDASLRPAYTALVADVGRAAAAVASREQAGELLVSALESRRQELSGVNLDEEMLRLVEMEQLYEASARYLQVVNETTQTLMELL